MKCDKTRNRKGQWCLTETAKYKMNKHLGGFKEEAEEKFNELAAEKYDFKSKGCPDGFRSQGSKTISGKRREVCCTPDGKTCMTADGIPL